MTERSFYESDPNATDPKPEVPRIPIEPFFNNVLVEREEQEKYVGSLYLPETTYEKPMGARVVAVGPECRNIGVGDFVLVGKYAGAEVAFRNRRYVVIREEEILGRVDESA